MHLQTYKRMKFQNEKKNDHGMSKVTTFHSNYGSLEGKLSAEVIDYSDVFSLSNLLQRLDSGKYGSVTKEYETLHAKRMQVITKLSALRPSLASDYSSPVAMNSQHGVDIWSDMATKQNKLNPDIIDLEVDSDVKSSPSKSSSKSKGNASTSIIVLDSDEEDGSPKVSSQKAIHHESEASIFQEYLRTQVQSRERQSMILATEGHLNQLVPYAQGNGKFDGNFASKANWRPSVQYEKVVLQKVPEEQRSQDLVNENYVEKRDEGPHGESSGCKMNIAKVSDVEKGENQDGEAFGREVNMLKISSVESRQNGETEKPESDGLEDLWKDMSLAIECSKSITFDGPIVSQEEEEGEKEQCDHSYVLQDDLGLVCRICGVIQKSIETIFDYQWVKGSRAARSYMSGSRSSRDADETIQYEPKVPEDDFEAAEISIHPRHLKQMKPHQLEGFNFLVRNLVADKPGGCILAHAPGSGKTFMLISFIQSFLAKYPSARPLVVLPKGILPTWKKEFQRWQVEDIPLYDLYTSQAISRVQQLEVLKCWQENKSILFLGYKQFSNIICGRATNNIEAACQDLLLKVPTLLILDEGHTPRNEDTNILESLARVQTRRKVVLSGTLFQNHVKEVFNILKLVRPRFLKMESSRAVVKRVLSRVHISGGRKLYKGGVDNCFYDLVEDTLQNDENFKRKVAVIQDLRELTKDVLHYYKGDFLEELPGLIDYTVLLNLTPRQKEIVQKLGTFDKFKRSAVGSAIYIHPQLRGISENAAGDRVAAFSDENIDNLLDSVNVRDGVKTRFFLSILSLSDSAGEKVLAFSQYILPMKFLERLISRTKGWQVGKEIFMITGDSNPEQREWAMETFNTSPDAKILFGSIKACGEGISLVGASRVIILDVHLNPSVTRQAIGRAFRPGQEKKVYIYRMVAADSPEEEDHKTSFKKELISKMWFEWSEYCGHQDFELGAADIDSCEDVFLESLNFGEDIKALYRR